MLKMIIAAILALSSAFSAAPAEVTAVRGNTVTFDVAGELYDYDYEQLPSPYATGDRVALVFDSRSTADPTDDAIIAIFPAE